MVTVFHGTAVWNIPALLSGKSRDWSGLYVTESADLAQRYADAQATQEVSSEARHAVSSAVVEMNTSDTVVWRRRAENHNTLDVCEAVIKTWSVRYVTVYTTSFNLKSSSIKVDGRYISTFAYLREQLGDCLNVVVVDA